MDKQKYLDLEITTEFARGHTTYLRPFLDAIMRRVVNPVNSVLLEVGIGTGLCSIFLERKGYKNVFGIDIEEDIVRKFMLNTREKFKSAVPVFVADAFNLRGLRQQIPIEIIFHQGLLEHFKEQDITKLLDHHLEMVSGYVVFCVPLIGYEDSKDYDENEQRWPISKWLEFLNRYSVYEYGVFGIDICKEQAYFAIRSKE